MSNLNGLNLNAPSVRHGITWQTWKGRVHSLSEAEMAVRMAANELDGILHSTFGGNGQQELIAQQTGGKDHCPISTNGNWLSGINVGVRRSAKVKRTTLSMESSMGLGSSMGYGVHHGYGVLHGHKVQDGYGVHHGQ